MSNSPWEFLRRRVGPLHNLWQWAVEDLTLEQINHHERAGVVPLAYSFLHLVTTEDRFISERILGESPLWESSDWPERVGGNLPSVRRGSPLDTAESVRFADLDAWRGFQTAVFARTDQAIAGIADERFTEVVFERVPKDASRGGFISMVAGDDPLILGDLMDMGIYQHGIRHLGEVEHARALVGLRGLD